MDKIKLVLPALVIAMSIACSPSARTTAVANTADSSMVNLDTQSISKLTATMTIVGTQHIGQPIVMTFTVYNPTDHRLNFCKWHTPFEALMSKYLDINTADGKEANYKGPMAKRIMPPPADSYVSIAAKDSLSIKVDLTRGYDFKTAGTYTIRYNSLNISGLNTTDNVSFILK